MFDSIAWLMELCRQAQYRKEAGMVIEDINSDRKHIADLEADLAAARADATLLRSTLIGIAAAMGMSSLPSYSEWEKVRNKALHLVASLAGERKP